MTSHKGYFITLEGGDGSGKSTVLEYLHKELLKQGIDHVKTREPGGTPLGNEVRKLLLLRSEGFQYGGRAELMLFLASRAQHVEELIFPALQAGKVVLCDRFNDSSIAYQGAARRFGMEEVEAICQFASAGLKPDLTLFLDVDPQRGIERVKNTMKQESTVGDLDRIESETLLFHEEVHRAYLKLAERDPQRIVRIDAGRSIESVCEQALKVVLPALAQYR